MLESLYQKWWLIILAAGLILAAWTDIRSGKVFNCITYPAVLIGLAGHAIFGGTDIRGFELGLSSSLMGLAVGFIPMFLAWRMGGIGGGDAKLTAAVGALGGWHFAVGCLFYTFACTLLMAVIVMLKRKIFKQTASRVWVFLLTVLVRGKPGDPTDEKSPKIAFAVAVLIGTILVSLDNYFGWFISQGLN